MDTQRATEDLNVIRQLMERPIRCSTMSGLSGIAAGAVAVIGSATDGFLSPRVPDSSRVLVSMLVWGCVLAVAFASAVVLTRMRERRRAMPPWSPVKRRILLTILGPFIASVGLTGAILFRCCWNGHPGDVYYHQLIQACWMLFYGLALWQMGGFSPVEVRILGAGFLAAGLVAAGIGRWDPYWSMAVSFGGFHLVYGIVVWVRHGG